MIYNNKPDYSYVPQSYIDKINNMDYAMDLNQECLDLESKDNALIYEQCIQMIEVVREKMRFILL